MNFSFKNITLASALVIGTAGLSQAITAEVATPPSSIAHTFESQKDNNVSDDFLTISPSKWAIRKNKSSGVGSMIKAANNTIEREGDTSYLSLLANSTSEAGISALHSHQDGFTVVRWRIRGITADQKYAGHPSIWSFSWNFSDNSRQDNNGGYTTEIDWMEYDNTYKIYHSRIIPAYNQVSDIGASAFMFKDRNDFDGWHVQGYQNTAAGLQVWEYKNGRWDKIGVPVSYSNAHKSGVGGSITAGYRSPQWFILSNVWFEKAVYNHNPVRLDIDYLHHYKSIAGSDTPNSGDNNNPDNGNDTPAGSNVIYQQDTLPINGNRIVKTIDISNANLADFTASFTAGSSVPLGSTASIHINLDGNRILNEYLSSPSSSTDIDLSNLAGNTLTIIMKTSNASAGFAMRNLLVTSPEAEDVNNADSSSNQNDLVLTTSRLTETFDLSEFSSANFEATLIGASSLAGGKSASIHFNLDGQRILNETLTMPNGSKQISLNDLRGSQLTVIFKSGVTDGSFKLSNISISNAN
ncbi:hypothetical protein [Agaribacterium sp. ZY112]|uniref:hypothetical protein n=1 Tax=Agaribacterium sp. ZY112 TaxID=3233574 RepID=UPI0035254BDA